MRYVFVIALALAFYSNAAAQTASQETDKPKAGSFRKPLEDAQKSKAPPTGAINLAVDDGCGNPLAETASYNFRNGKVIVVTDDNKLVVKIARGGNKSSSGSVKTPKYENPDDVKRLQQPQLLTVSLVGIDETVNRSEVKKFLLDNVLEREVSLIGNTRQNADKSLDALVKLTSGELKGEVSQLLLEQGIAKFKEFDLTNIVPSRTACELKRAEAKAQEEKIGIWAK